MVLDEVLQEENRSFDRDDMIDIFTEGFLYALEMQENGNKVKNIEELSINIAEAANITIKESIAPYTSALGSAVSTRLLGGTIADVSNVVFSKICRDIIRRLKDSPKYKKYEKFNKRLTYPVKNVLLAFFVKISLVPNILFELLVDKKEEHEAKKYIDMLLNDANKEYKGIIKRIDVKIERNNDYVLFLITRQWNI